MLGALNANSIWFTFICRDFEVARLGCVAFESRCIDKPAHHQFEWWKWREKHLKKSSWQMDFCFV